MARTLHKADFAKDPMVQFDLWYNEALTSGLTEPSAMNLSTATKDGKPSSRIVLLKDFSEEGFSFYTNYKSRKCIDLLENPFAALTFFWPTLEKQVRIEGRVSKVHSTTSDNYFTGRSRGSQIGASISSQSSEIPNREYLDNQFSEFEMKMQNQEIARPGNWGGFILKPIRIEFWQSQPNRLHDRILYSMSKSQWLITRLAP